MPLIDWLRQLRDSNPDLPAPPPTVGEPHRAAFVAMLHRMRLKGRHLRMAGIGAPELRRHAGLGAVALKDLGADAFGGGEG